MKLFHLLPSLLVYVCLYYLSFGADFGCKTFIPDAPLGTVSADVIGICLAKRYSLNGITYETSRQYFC